MNGEMALLHQRFLAGISYQRSLRALESSVAGEDEKHFSFEGKLGGQGLMGMSGREWEGKLPTFKEEPKTHARKEKAKSKIIIKKRAQKKEKEAKKKKKKGWEMQWSHAENT